MHFNVLIVSISFYPNLSVPLTVFIKIFYGYFLLQGDLQVG